MIDFGCPKCGTRQRVPDAAAGKRVSCAKCGQRLKVPESAEMQTMAAVLAPPPASVVKSAARSGKQWFYQDQGQQCGPVSWAELRRMAAEGELSPEDRVWSEGMAKWQLAHTIPNLFPRESEGPPPLPPAAKGTSGKASAALVLGLVGFCLGPLTGIPAIILALVSLGEIGRSRGRLGGKGMAISGLILGCLGSLLCVVGSWIVYGRVGEARERLVAENHLKQIGLAMENYQDSGDGHLPQAHPDPLVKPETKLSWRVAILPYIEQDNLWRQFRQDEPWDSPHNKTLLTPMPYIFAHPKHPEDNEKGLTYFRVFTGVHTPFPPGGPMSLQSITAGDGTSNTILVVEAAEPVLGPSPTSWCTTRPGRCQSSAATSAAARLPS
jgi:hypothetical protein